MISIVVPVYNEKGIIPITAKRLDDLLKQNNIVYELIFVDDGSKDGSWEDIQNVTKDHSCVTGLQFSRNFGKEAAIFAGLSHARGDACAIMDCDLQHPPEKLLDMIALWEEGYEVINGVKADRGKEGTGYHLAAKTFNKIMSRLSHFDMEASSDFKLLDRRVIDALLVLQERRTFFRALVPWSGFKSVDVPFTVQERMQGETSFSTTGLIRYAFSNISAFSSAPLQLVTFVGFFFFLAATILGFQTFFNWLEGTAADGFTTVILLLLMIGSMLMISLGIIGYYLSQIYIELKGRPRYVIRQTTPNIKEDTINDKNIS